MLFPRTWALAAMVCIGTSSTWAQTAEETAAFILFGIEDGTKTSLIEGGAWRETANGSYGVSGITSGRPSVYIESFLEVRRRDPCNFEIQTYSITKGEKAVTASQKATITVDFSKIRRVHHSEPDGPLGRVVIRNLEFSGKEVSCHRIHEDTLSDPEEEILRRLGIESDPVHAYSATPEIARERRCMTQDTGTVFPSPEIFLPPAEPALDSELRLELAVSYFKENFCPMRGF